MFPRILSGGGLAAIIGAGMLLTAGSSTASAAFTVPPAKSVINSLKGDLTDVRWQRCWRDRWGRRRRVRCG